MLKVAILSKNITKTSVFGVFGRVNRLTVNSYQLNMYMVLVALDMAVLEHA